LGVEAIDRFGYPFRSAHLCEIIMYDGDIRHRLLIRSVLKTAAGVPGFAAPRSVDADWSVL
jgi:hypothetical protein